MGETVYADILFFINFSMDFLCFYICSRVLGRPLACLRAALASAMGGVYSVAMLIWCPDGIVSLLLDVSVLLIMCAVFFSLQIMIIDHYVDRVNPVALSSLQFFIVGVISAICMFILN